MSPSQRWKSVLEIFTLGFKLLYRFAVSPHCTWKGGKCPDDRFVSPDAMAGLVSHRSRVKTINLHLTHQSYQNHIFMISENRATGSGCGSSLNKLCTLNV